MKRIICAIFIIYCILFSIAGVILFTFPSKFEMFGKFIILFYFPVSSIGAFLYYNYKDEGLFCKDDEMEEYLLNLPNQKKCLKKAKIESEIKCLNFFGITITLIVTIVGFLINSYKSDTFFLEGYLYIFLYILAIVVACWKIMYRLSLQLCFLEGLEKKKQTKNEYFLARVKIRNMKRK